MRAGETKRRTRAAASPSSSHAPALSVFPSLCLPPSPPLQNRPRVRASRTPCYKMLQNATKNRALSRHPNPPLNPSRPSASSAARRFYPAPQGAPSTRDPQNEPMCHSVPHAKTRHNPPKPATNPPAQIKPTPPPHLPTRSKPCQRAPSIAPVQNKPTLVASRYRLPATASAPPMPTNVSADVPVQSLGRWVVSLRFTQNSATIARCPAGSESVHWEGL